MGWTSRAPAPTAVRARGGLSGGGVSLCATRRHRWRATVVAATTNNHTCAYPTFDHTGTERACIEIAKALMHDGRARREVSSEPYTSGICNSHVCWRHIIGHARELVDGGHLEREVALSCLHSRLWHTRALAGTESRPSDVG